ncbi:MAG: 2OG-Fe(II) oxygenase [Proteobacteria bacterium]|nr:2OG-Fe(II) oxygenase [Pseudomonadota bacterium]
MILGKIPAASPEEPLSWINASCAQRYPLAMLFQATLAALGVARKQSYEDAIRFVADAAATGDARAQGQLAALGGADAFNPEDWLNPPAAVRHFDAPRIVTIENFLPPRVCAWHIHEAGHRLQPAPIKDPESGRAALSAIRNNSGCGFSSIEADLVLQMTNLRIAAAVGAPVWRQEPTNILHYAPGEEYKPHYDFVREDEEAAFTGELQRLGQRVATCLIYLNDNFVGGETVFPHLQWSYKGRAGDALVFWNMSANGERERNSLHAGSRVVSGEKWLYSKWIRAKTHPLT